MGKGKLMSKKLMARGPVNTSILGSRRQIPMSKNVIVKTKVNRNQFVYNYGIPIANYSVFQENYF